MGSCLYWLLKAGLTNPGYIPKQIPPYARGPLNAPTIASCMQNYLLAVPPLRSRTLKYPLNGHTEVLKYCETCEFYVGFILRPPKASHCVDCDLCVEGYDHHCPWIGTCVGKRNYRFFVYFLTSIFLYCIFSFTISILHMKFVADEHSNWLEALEELGFTLALFAYIIPFLSFATIMMSLHTYFICYGLSTREFIKKLVVRSDKRSIFVRFKTIFCKTLASVQYDYKNTKLVGNLHRYGISYSQQALGKQNKGVQLLKDTKDVRFMQAKADHNSSKNYDYRIVYTPDASSINNMFI